MGNNMGSKLEWASLCWAVLGIDRGMVGLVPVSRQDASLVKSGFLRLVTIRTSNSDPLVALSEVYSPYFSGAMVQSLLSCFSKDPLPDSQGPAGKLLSSENPSEALSPFMLPSLVPFSQ